MGKKSTWNLIQDSVDCRTEAEAGEPDTGASGRDPRMAGGGERPLATSRYSGVTSFICNHKDGCDPHSSTATYNDALPEVDEATVARSWVGTLMHPGCLEL